MACTIASVEDVARWPSLHQIPKFEFTREHSHFLVCKFALRSPTSVPGMSCLGSFQLKALIMPKTNLTINNANDLLAPFFGVFPRLSKSIYSLNASDSFGARSQENDQTPITPALGSPARRSDLYNHPDGSASLRHQWTTLSSGPTRSDLVGEGLRVR